MILRMVNLLVIAALVVAAAWVYRIKYESAAQAERVAKLRIEVRHERDKIAALRAKWSELDDPARIEALAKRFLKLKQIKATQFDSLDNLPPQPPAYLRPGAKDPIGEIIRHLGQTFSVTGSIAGRPTAGPQTPAPHESSAPVSIPASHAGGGR